MSLPLRLLLVTFIESIATIFIERGEMFLTRDRLHFSDPANLWLALLFGLTYCIGSFSSHRVTHRVGERRMVLASLAVQVAICTGMGLLLHPAVIFIGSGLLGATYGLKWAVIESFVSAGLDSRQTAKVIGRFNIAWSAAVPVALFPSGVIIASWPPALFFLPAVISIGSLWLLRNLPAKPAHRERLQADGQAVMAAQRTAGLLAFSRWQMLSSYSLMFILAPLTPGIFARLGYTVRLQTVLAALLDVVRLTTFYLLHRTVKWHGRFGPLISAMLVMPLGFFLIILAPNVMAMAAGSTPAGVAAALAGEVLFGMAAAMTYYAALYYAMVLTNAAVRGGGAHEGVIGLGFALGPAAGLIGSRIAPGVGTLIGVLPLLIVPAAASMRIWSATKRLATEVTE